MSYREGKKMIRKTGEVGNGLYFNQRGTRVPLAKNNARRSVTDVKRWESKNSTTYRGRLEGKRTLESEARASRPKAAPVGINAPVRNRSETKCKEQRGSGPGSQEGRYKVRWRRKIKS